MVEVADSQIGPKPPQITPKIALFDPNFTSRSPKSHKNPGVGEQIWERSPKKNRFFFWQPPLIVSRLGLPSEYDYWLAEYSPIIPQKSITTSSHTDKKSTNIKNYINKKPIKLIKDRKMDFIYANDLYKIVQHYLDNLDAPRDVNCVYENKVFLSDIADMINNCLLYTSDAADE